MYMKVKKLIKYITQLFKSIIIALIASMLIITFVFQTVCVEGNSMYKTLHNGDKIIVEKVSYYFHMPKRNDIIVFKCPSNTKEKYIKRVIAVAGDKVKIDSDRVYVNGKMLKENYTFYEKNQYDDLTIHYYEETTVPKDTVFVLGDNRYNSEDSRSKYVGFVSKKLIVGRATLKIYPFKNVGRIR